MFQTLSFSGMGILGIVVALMTELMLFVLIALIYLVRQLVIYLFVLMMPLLIVPWIPGVGPFTLVSKFMKKLAGFYVPFLFMTVPVALLFRVGELLGASTDLSAGGIGAWLSAVVVPIAAIASPFVLFWQAGATFFMADRASQHVSAQKAGQRMQGGRDRAGQTAQGGRNFVRGVRNQPAIRFRISGVDVGVIVCTNFVPFVQISKSDSPNVDQFTAHGESSNRGRIDSSWSVPASIPSRQAFVMFPAWITKSHSSPSVSSTTRRRGDEVP